jgi:hypothetical protein
MLLILKPPCTISHVDIGERERCYLSQTPHETKCKSEERKYKISTHSILSTIGYYRVNYDKKNWELLSAALTSGLITSPVAKAQLIDDAFNLAKSAQLEYSYALGLTQCVAGGEDSKIVWDMLLNNMGFLKHNLKTTAGYVYFQVRSTS